MALPDVEKISKFFTVVGQGRLGLILKLKLFGTQ
jgi:hypothetical protein